MRKKAQADPSPGAMSRPDRAIAPAQDAYARGDPRRGEPSGGGRPLRGSRPRLSLGSLRGLGNPWARRGLPASRPPTTLMPTGKTAGGCRRVPAAAPPLRCRHSLAAACRCERQNPGDDVGRGRRVGRWRYRVRPRPPEPSRVRHDRLREHRRCRVDDR
jgi:hypothetical protein